MRVGCKNQAKHTKDDHYRQNYIAVCQSKMVIDERQWSLQVRNRSGLAQDDKGWVESSLEWVWLEMRKLGWA